MTTVKAKFFVKGHMSDFSKYDNIECKELYPVAFSPLEIRDSNISELNIRRKWHTGNFAQYDFKDTMVSFLIDEEDISFFEEILGECVKIQEV